MLITGVPAPRLKVMLPDVPSHSYSAPFPFVARMASRREQTPLLPGAGSVVVLTTAGGPPRPVSGLQAKSAARPSPSAHGGRKLKP